MHKIWHGGKLDYDEFIKSKDNIFCVLQKGFNTSKMIYCIKKNSILKGIISDNTYELKDIKSLQIYEVSKNHKINYIKNNTTIENLEELTLKELDELFIRIYKEFE